MLALDHRGALDRVLALSWPAMTEGAALLADRYELVSLLGAGGMGSVYLARDTELDELVAVKMLAHDVLEIAGVMDRFRREVKLARRVTHRNVARTFDIGEHEGARFLTMEYVDGESLGERIEGDGPFAFAEVVEIACAIAEALVAAHAVGIVHRDLKPENVLVARDGRVVVTDFGIASTPLGDDADLTMGRPLGTPAYMAPEQIDGRPVDHRADIYALGEIIYAMITGHDPWHGPNDYAVAAARLMEPPPNPQARRRSTSDELAAIVTKAMARAPEDRFADATEMLEALHALQPQKTKASIPPRSESRDAVTKLGLTLADATATVALPGAATGKKRVAVLPFKNAGPDEDAYLGGAISESLVDALSMNGALKLTAYGVLASTKPDDDPRTVGQRAGVQVVVAGTVVRIDDRIHLTARLVSVADGFQIWAKRFEGSKSELVRLMDEVAEAIGTGIAVEAGKVDASLPAHPDVVDLYLRARHEHRKLGGTKRAIELCREALAIAPNDPILLAANARFHSFVMESAIVPAEAEEATRIAKESASRALVLAPGAAVVQLAAAEIAQLEGDLIAAARGFRAAVRADPRMAEGHVSLGVLRAQSGDVEGGLRLIERARWLDASLPRAESAYVTLHELLGNHDMVDATLTRTHGAAFLFPRIMIAMLRKDFAEASRLYDALPNVESARRVRFLLQGLRQRSYDAESLAMFDALTGTRRLPMRVCTTRKLGVQVAMCIDDHERAMAWLCDADDAGLADVLWLDRCVLLDPLRPRPEFGAIAERVRERAANVLAAIIERA